MPNIFDCDAVGPDEAIFFRVGLFSNEFGFDGNFDVAGDGFIMVRLQ